MAYKSTKFVVILFIMFIINQLFAANGRIQGFVTDATTDEALPGANVFFEGTSIGGATDVDGAYIITDVPPGSYTISVVYIGYEKVSFSLDIGDGQSIDRNITMNAVALKGEEIVVTAQAEGQNAAINKQLSSENIVNVVSSARIQELPDANAAESIGRLPGVSLIRSGGQATQVVIRGLSPEFNQITIAGVPVPSNESARQIDSRDQEGSSFGGGRGSDMRMISSNMLDEIQVFKTNTPDMDAAVIGGTVDLGIRKAEPLGQQPFGLSYLPGISFQAQGGYTALTDEYNNYKFDLILERRFLNDRLGVLIQGIVQQQNHTANNLVANYTQIARSINPDSLALQNLNLYFYPRKENRYNGTISFDYNIPNGSLALMNIISQSKSNENYFQQQYGLVRDGANANAIHYYVNNSPNKLNLITNIFRYTQKTDLVNINSTLSHSYSENISPDSWTLNFEQLGTGTININDRLKPVDIAKQAFDRADLDNLNLRGLNTSNSFTSQRDLRGALDLSRDFNFENLFSLQLKAGGMYSYSDRFHDYNRGGGSVFFGPIGDNIVAEYPWLATEYGIGGTATNRIFMTPFIDPNFKVGTFLNGDYEFNNKLDMNYMRRIKELIVDYGLNLDAAPTGGAGAWVPNMFGNQASDYSGTEKRSAGYLMSTFDIGQSLSLMVGARYQNLTTSYRANRFYNANADNPYPNQLPHTDTTVTKSHGYWLPAVNIKYNPLSWLSIRGAYTNTLAYPSYRAIIPIIDVFTGRVNWNNANLKPQTSENYDLQLSVYNNELGLFTFGGFVKHIDNFVFFEAPYINFPDRYDGLHDIPGYPLLNVKGYSLSTYYNNPYRVDLWGIESDWQTHFWYLPGALNGLVLNINYTHNFSEAKYPRTVVGNSGPPLFLPTYNDTTYTDALINQPDDIVNVSMGWDYKGFSILLSMIYQSGIFNSTNFYNANRTDKAAWTRFDLAAKQKLPWYNTELFLNLNNLNGENDTYIRRGNGFRDRDESYGLTAQLGLRVNLR